MEALTDRQGHERIVRTVGSGRRVGRLRRATVRPDEQHGMEVGHHRLELVDPCPVTLPLLGAEEEHAQPDESHAADTAGDQIRHLLGHERLARDPDPPDDDEHGAEHRQAPPGVGPDHLPSPRLAPFGRAGGVASAPGEGGVERDRRAGHADFF